MSESPDDIIGLRRVYTDVSTAYKSCLNHEIGAHRAGEYVRCLKGGKMHTNGVESFRIMLKQVHKRTCHKLSSKDLQRHVNELAGRQNIREQDTIDQMVHIFAHLIGKRLMCRTLIAD